ncbi:MAG TPA: methylated-DNA--[protein]-cysteine S-methyltransferase [Syntrophorhabdaceae bacterium]|nr:methylated-DNA--[protein]-cysteine S-methyltransferase [Syntrophorhabdaceae bacterium]
MKHIEYTLFESSIGIISVVSENDKIISLNVHTGKNIHESRKYISGLYPDGTQADDSFKTIKFLLNKYLKGEKVVFDVPLDISRQTPFTRSVLQELLKIPHGQVRSYGWIGKQLGYSMAARAVGQAVGRNPILILIPCHRIIAGHGKLGGFSSGIEIKKRLLSLEGVLDRSERIRSNLTQIL